MSQAELEALQAIANALPKQEQAPVDIPPSGKVCLGIHFTVPSFDGIDRGTGETTRNWSATAFYRRCGWDGDITPQVPDGEYCPACGRVCKSNDAGLLEHAIPVKAAQCWIEQIKQWVLVEVASP